MAPYKAAKKELVALFEVKAFQLRPNLKPFAIRLSTDFPNDTKRFVDVLYDTWIDESAKEWIGVDAFNEFYHYYCDNREYLQEGCEIWDGSPARE